MGPESLTNALKALFSEVDNKTADSIGSLAKNFKDYLGLACTKSMALPSIVPFEILLVIQNLRGNLASEFKCVLIKDLKAVTLSIIEPLISLINLSLQKGP